MGIDFTSMDERLKNRQRKSIFDPTPNLEIQVIGEKDERKLPEYVKPEMFHEIKPESLREGLVPITPENPYEAAKRVFGLPFYELKKPTEGEVEVPALAPFRRSVVNTGSTISQGTEIPDTAVEKAIAMNKEELDAWQPKSGIGQWWKRVQEKNVELWEQDEFMQIYEDVEDYQNKMKEGQRISHIADKAKDLPENYVEPGFWGQAKEGQQNFWNNLMAISARHLERKFKDKGFPRIEENAEKITDYFRSRSAEHPEWQQPSEFTEQTLLEKLGDRRYYARALSEGLPSTLISLGAGAITLLGTKGNTGAALGTTYLTSKYLEGGFAYEEAISNGASPQQADEYSDLYSTIAAGIELVPEARLLNKITGGAAVKRTLINRIVKEVIIQGVLEGGEEAIQEATAIALEKMYNENAQFWTNKNMARIADAGTQGAIIGFATGGGGEVIRTSQDIYDGIKQKSIDVLSTDLTQQILANEAGFARIPGAEVVKPVTPEIQPLIGEASQFIKRNENEFFHASPVENIKELKTSSGIAGEGIYLARNVESARASSAMQGDGNLLDVGAYKVEVQGDLFKANDYPSEIEINKIKDDGFTGIDIGGEIIVFDSKDVKIISEISPENLDKLLRKDEPKKPTIKEQIKTREEAKIARDLAKTEREALVFEPVLESQYQTFKNLNAKESEDIRQLRTKNQELTTQQFDDIFFSQDQSSDEIFDVFKDRLTQERKPLPKIPKETKGIVAETVRTKEKDKAKEARIKILKDIKEKTGRAETVKRGIIDYASKHLDLNEKGKLLATIKNAKTFKDFDKAAKFIEKLGEKADTRKLLTKIVKELKATKVKKQAGKPVGKFTADIQNVLEEIKKTVVTTTEEANAKIQANLEKYPDQIPPESVAFENEILSRYADIKNMSVEELKKVLEEIRKMKDTGRMIRELKRFNRESEIQAFNRKIIEEITGGKGVPETIKTTGAIKKTNNLKEFFNTLGKSIVGWTDVMNMLTSKATDKEGKSIKPGESFLEKQMETLEEENAESRGLRLATERLQEMVKEAYGVKKDRQVSKLIRENTKEESLGTFENADGNKVEITFSKDEAIKRWMEMQDPTLDETFREGMGYTDDIMDSIRAFLSKEDKKFARLQLDFYKKYYRGVNSTYREIYGVDLPFNNVYSPIRRSGISRNANQGFGEFGQEINVRNSITTGSHKTRVTNIKPIKKAGSMQVLTQHVSEMEHFKAWAETVRNLNSSFGNAEVRTAIESNYGHGMLSVIDNFIQDFTRGGAERAGALGRLDKWRVRFTKGVLAAKPAIGVKQLVSFVAYADDIPIKDFITGYADFWKNPIENGKILREGSELLKSRGQNMERDIKSATNSDAYKAWKKKDNFLNQLMLNIKLGDQGAIIMGGWAVYRYTKNIALRDGKTVEQAHRAGITQFEKTTKRAQQSAALSDLSIWQRGGPFAKLFTMFKSSPNQYLRKEIWAIRNLLNKRGSIKQHVKTIAIYHFILPQLFQFVSNFFDWDKEEQKRAAWLGSLNGLFIFGDALDYILRKALKMKTFGMDVPVVSPFKEAGNGVMKLFPKDGDLSTEDVLSAVGDMADATGQFTGTPAKYTFNVSQGLRYLFKGDYEKAAGMLAGWSEYAIDVGNGGKKETLPASTRPGGINRLKIKRPTINRLKINRPKINRLKIKR